jgi:hypothetical protein
MKRRKIFEVPPSPDTFLLLVESDKEAATQVQLIYMIMEPE